MHYMLKLKVYDANIKLLFPEFTIYLRYLKKIAQVRLTKPTGLNLREFF